MSRYPCIYCRRRDVPRTREHVLQEAFGAKATLDTEVCGDCNSAFSSLDKILVDVVDFFHLGKHSAQLVRGGDMLNFEGVRIVARRCDGGVLPVPQLYELDTTRWCYYDAEVGCRDLVFNELANPTRLRLSVRHVPENMQWPTRTISRSGPYKYVIQGTDPTTVEALRDEIQRDGFKTTDRGSPAVYPPDTASNGKLTVSARIEPYCRAMAKVALNYVCYRLGAQVALSPQFDPIRAYARYGYGRHQDFVVPTTRFPGMADACAGFVEPGAHALLLCQQEDRISVFVTLNALTVGRVDLKRDIRRLPMPAWLLSRFAPPTRSIENLTLPDDIPKAIVNPSASGLDELLPSSWRPRSV